MDKIYTYENKKAFTMVELLAVIIILGILLIIAVPTVLNVIPGAKRNLFVAQVQKDLEKVQNYYTMHDDVFDQFNVDTCFVTRITDAFLQMFNIKNHYEGYILIDKTNLKIYVVFTNGEYILQSFTLDDADNLQEKVIPYDETTWNTVASPSNFCINVPDCMMCIEFLSETSQIVNYHIGNIQENIIYPNEVLRQIMESISGGINNIKEIKTVNYINESGVYINALPKERNHTGYSTYMWFENGILYFGTNADKIYVSSGFQLFRDLTYLKKADLSLFDFHYCTNISQMFDQDINLEELIATWDTSFLNDISYVFRRCEKLKSIDVSNWDVSRVRDFADVFADCKSIEYVEVTRWNTGNAEGFFQMFFNCSKLKYVNVSMWDTSKAKSMRGMFQNCVSLTELDVSNFDTSNVTDLGYMFYRSPYINKIDLTNFNTSKVTHFDYMVSCARNYTIDTSNFDMSSAEMVDHMFSDITNQTTISFKPIINNKNLDTTYMIYNCPNLKTVDLSFLPKGIIPKTIFGCTSLQAVYVPNIYTGTMTIQFSNSPKITLTKIEA